MKKILVVLAIGLISTAAYAADYTGGYTGAQIDAGLAKVMGVADANTVLAGPTTGADAAPTMRALVVGDLPASITGVTYTGPVIFAEVDGHATGDLSAGNVERTFINSFGRGGAATLTLPAAAAGYTFVAIVGTKHNSAWKIQRNGTDTIYWDAAGTLTPAKTYFQETNQEIGSRVSCATFRTGASAYSWVCGSISGTWVTD